MSASFEYKTDRVTE